MLHLVRALLRLPVVVSTVHRKEWPDPTPEMLVDDPVFDAIWNVIWTWDIGVPGVYAGHMGAAGNHARKLRDAVEPFLKPRPDGATMELERMAPEPYSDEAIARIEADPNPDYDVLRLWPTIQRLQRALEMEVKRGKSLELALAEHQWRQQLVKDAAEGNLAAIRTMLRGRPDFEEGKFW